MDAFESLMALLLRRQGYWTETTFKVELTKEEKHAIGRPSSPRWELDLIAYRGGTNELLVIECKSYLDSTGVMFRNGAFEPPDRYKLFGEATLRNVVLRALVRQLEHEKRIPPNTVPVLALATGRTANSCDRESMRAHFEKNGWRIFGDSWIKDELRDAVADGYENDLALVVAKLLMRAERE